MRVRGLAALTAIVLAAAMGGTAQADFYAHEGSFDGAGSVPDGAFVEPKAVAVHFAGDSVLVLDKAKETIQQFGLTGVPKPFASKGVSNSLDVELDGFRNDLAVDNSGTASDGNIYVASEQTEGGPEGVVYGFDSAGNPLGGNWPLKGNGFCGVSVDPSGNVWAANNSATEYTAAGVPTGKAIGGLICQNHFNSQGAFYGQGGAGFEGATIRITRTDGFYEDLTEAKVVDGFDIDLVTDDVYINNFTNVLVLNRASEPIERFGEKEDFGTGYLGLKKSFGLAIDSNSGKVYMSDAGETPPSVEIFAPHAPLPPVASPGVVKEIRSTNAVIGSTINPGGGETEYSVEFGTDTNYGSIGLPSPVATIKGRAGKAVTINLKDLTPGVKYHYRVVAKNSTTTTKGPDQTLITYAPTPGLDSCPNQLVRKQTGAAGLADCRAYELASAEDSGGYNVLSDLVPGQRPLPGFPEATDPSKLLYSLESGSIPGAGVPTSFADDPYVATRGEDGWHTKYVGIPADIGSDSPFSSAFTAADRRLQTFAFAGPDLCDPCFGDGKTGIPVRGSDGTVIQGMAGAEDPGEDAEAKVFVRKPLSADGSHLIFGSTEPFESDAPALGDPAIYSRDLATAATHVVSKTDSGANIACLEDCNGKGVAGLDVSADGSRVVVGQLDGTGPSGADLWHPYVNVDGASSSFDLAPGASAGVLYYGMTDDGSKAFISSDEQLTADDNDDSVDVFRADITPGGATLARITTGSGGSGDTDSCDPVADAVHERWNSLGPVASCDVVPVAGGGGLGSVDGSFYFLSPEQLDDSSGVADAPNLYLAKPDGAVVFVATLDSDLNPAEVPTYTRHQVGEITGLTAPGQIVVDPDSKLVYVTDSETNTVSRFDEDGTPVPFSFAAPYVSGNQISGTSSTAFGLNPLSQLAIDESSGASDGYLYVGDTEGSGDVDVFKQSGEYLGGLGTSGGACGVATNGTGSIYAIGGFFSYRYKPSISGVPSEFTAEGPSFNFGGSCQAASDSANNLYIQLGEGGPTRKYKGSDWESGTFTTLADSSTALAGESGSDDYLIDHGGEVDQFHADGTLAVTDVGGGDLIDSHGVASVAGGNLYATDRADQTVKIFGPPEVKYLPEISSSPIAVHGLEEPDVLDSSDIQVEPSGGSAAFISSVPLTEAVSGQQRQIFRYDAPSAALDCVSCNPTGLASGDGGRLAAYGSSLASKGRVFFNTKEPLVLRDANGKVDAYQWSKAAGVQLVSPGNSQFDNTLLSVSRDGKDAYFFTRNTLVPQDRNGELMKIYDAREGGGFLVPSQRAPCAASDECHGAGSEAPAPLAINTVGDKTKKGGNFKPPKKKCGKGKILKKGKCKPKKTKKKKKKSHAKKGSRR
jgi:sugar lactone lactonase YvrE